MLSTIKTVSSDKHTNYTDIANNSREVKHSVVLNNEDKREIEERIVEELYRIFTHKTG